MLAARPDMQGVAGHRTARIGGRWGREKEFLIAKIESIDGGDSIGLGNKCAANRRRRTVGAEDHARAHTAYIAGIDVFELNLSGVKIGPDAGFLKKELRSEEHTSELQSRPHLVCRLLL